MKKKDFVRLVLGVVGGMLFSLGLCMCLVPEWDAFREGVAVTGAGLAVLLILAAMLLRGRKLGRRISWKTVGKVLYAILSVLVLGVGMCFVLVWEQVLMGIAIGVAGIVLLLGLIPMCMGLK
jgi:O-antigen/teichoic acid export membrane protein